MLQDHLRELEKRLEAPVKSRPNEPGVFSFTIDQDLTVEFHQLEEGIFLKSQIAEVPDQDREKLFISLSEANLLGMGTKGSVFGLSEDCKHIVFNNLIDYDVTYQQFHDILEDFVNIAKIYQEEIQGSS